MECCTHRTFRLKTKHYNAKLLLAVLMEAGAANRTTLSVLAHFVPTFKTTVLLNILKIITAQKGDSGNRTDMVALRNDLCYKRRNTTLTQRTRGRYCTEI